MKKSNIKTKGELLDLIMHFFDDLEINKNSKKYHSLTYCITSIAYETVIIVKEKYSSNKVEIVFECDNISSLSMTWKHNFFIRKTYELLFLETKESYEEFNNMPIDDRIEMLSEITLAKINELKRIKNR
jgi:hypothetical protein